MYIPGPNSSSNAGRDNMQPGDPDINALAGAASYDACALEFDFVCITDTLLVTYVFGSEEYPEFVGTSFNDHFAFLLSGPGISGTENIALIPGTTTPVAINNVNALSWSTYYVDNAGGTEMQYDGYTTPLVAKHALVPGGTYHIKLVVADVMDGIYDSGVILMGGSFRAGGSAMNIESAAEDNIAVEGCSHASATILRTFGADLADTLYYTVTGSATGGIDYASLSGEVIFAAGDSTALIDIDAAFDGLSEGTETVTLHFTTSAKGAYFATDSLSFTIYDRVPCDAGTDTDACEGFTLLLGTAAAPGLSYAWSPSLGLDDATLAQPTLTAGAAGVYTFILTSTDRGGCSVSDTVSITVNPMPVAAFSESPVGLDLTFTNTSTDATSYSWDFGDGGTSTAANPTHSYTSGGSYTVTLIATNACGSDTTTTAVILLGTGSETGGSFALYPNPNEGEFTLSSEGLSSAMVEVFAADGRKVYSSTYINFGTSQKISLPRAAAGLFTVRVSTEKVVHTFRIVVR